VLHSSILIPSKTGLSNTTIDLLGVAATLSQTLAFNQHYCYFSDRSPAGARLMPLLPGHVKEPNKRAEKNPTIASIKSLALNVLVVLALGLTIFAFPLWLPGCDISRECSVCSSSMVVASLIRYVRGGKMAAAVVTVLVLVLALIRMAKPGQLIITFWFTALTVRLTRTCADRWNLRSWCEWSQAEGFISTLPLIAIPVRDGISREQAVSAKRPTYLIKFFCHHLQSAVVPKEVVQTSYTGIGVA